jgi:hypothetical protein
MITSLSFCQDDPNVLNNYKYVIIDFKVYPNGNKDIYQIGNFIYDELKKYGYNILLENNNYPSDFKENPCLAVICSYEETFSSTKGNSVEISFKNCKDELVFIDKKTRFICENTSTYYQYTTKDVLKSIKKVKYNYSGSTINPQYWTIDSNFKSILKKLNFLN